MTIKLPRRRYNGEVLSAWSRMDEDCKSARRSANSWRKRSREIPTLTLEKTEGNLGCRFLSMVVIKLSLSNSGNGLHCQSGGQSIRGHTEISFLPFFASLQNGLDSTWWKVLSNEAIDTRWYRRMHNRHTNNWRVPEWSQAFRQSSQGCSMRSPTTQYCTRQGFLIGKTSLNLWLLRRIYSCHSCESQTTAG